MTKFEIEEKIVAMLKTVFDPEIPVNVYDLGLIYKIDVSDLYEFSVGCHIYFLTRMPSPKIIFQAFEEVKPNLIVAVPLII